MTLGDGLRRAGWGVADQALSSVTNFGLAVVAARSVGAREFGSFALVFAVYTIFLGAARAWTTEPLALRHSVSPPAELAEATRTSAGVALAIGVAGGAGCALAGLLTTGPTRAGLLVLAAGLPGLLLQDAWRLAFFVAGRGRSAFANDALWALSLGLFLVVQRGELSVQEVLAAWGAGAAVAALAGGVQTGALPDLRRMRVWWSSNRAVIADLTADFAALTGSAQLWLFGTGAVAGLSAAGALRGGQVLLGPLNVLFMGAALVAVPEAVRWHHRSAATLVRRCLATAAALASASVLWGAAALLLPDGLGEELLGPTWEPARTVVLPLTAWMVASGVVAGLALGLRASGRTRRGVRVRAVTGIASVVAATAGAALGGAEGAAWGLAAATAAGILLWWRELQRVASDAGEPPRPEDPAETLAGGLA